MIQRIFNFIRTLVSNNLTPFVIIVILGVSIKFYRLDYKILWYDEIATVVQVAGADNVLQLDDSKLNEIVPISHYTGLLTHTDANYKLQEELKAQIQNMNLNPLHYMILSFWYRMIGDNPIHYRLFSVLIFLLTIPFMFGLAKELFKSKTAGWVAISLFAVSPFIHYFAQEARYYMLWAFLLAAIHYYLLKAVNNPALKWWAGYIVFSVLSLYTSILSGFIIFEHLLFVLFLKKESRIKFLITISIIVLFYLPWFVYLINNRTEIFSALSWHKFEAVPVWAPVLGYVLGSVRTFSFYLNYTLFWDDVFHNITPAMIVETGFNLIILSLIVLSVILLFKKEKRETAWFIFLIFIPGLVFFCGLDLARNAITTHWWRYYIFNTIPVLLIVSYLIFYYSKTKKLISRGVYIGIIVISFYSIFTISKYPYWYLGGEWEKEFVDNAELLSKAKKPLMVTDFMRLNSPWDGPMHSMEVLANCSSDEIDVLRVSANRSEIDKIIPDNTYSDVFVIYASDELLENLQKQFGDRMKIMHGRQGPPRWRIIFE
ncbi:MAG: glycosyltransferase family 39 protein [Bacteroidales bacterium]|nr:glycosyltransferase family 39 protein [Bacteroidales bacterium]MBN2817499.1 glycosyltransferase family 39 protein [Bacteroidales bacterium]